MKEPVGSINSYFIPLFEFPSYLVNYPYFPVCYSFSLSISR